MLESGAVLIHPIHGEFTVVDTQDCSDEFIDNEWRSGYMVIADFDKFIENIRWKNETGNSRLIFHSYYLKNVEVK